LVRKSIGVLPLQTIPLAAGSELAMATWFSVIEGEAI
jgi:hypothetical protein